MFDKWLIVDNSLCNVITETGHIEGFEFQIRIPYYRGVSLSVVDTITVKVQGQVYSNDNIRFTVESGSFMMKEMETVGTLRWNFDETAALRVYKPGGLLYLDADLDVDIVIRAPYLWFSGHDRKHLSLGSDKFLGLKAS
jgi:hypothetical protein